MACGEPYLLLPLGIPSPGRGRESNDFSDSPLMPAIWPIEGSPTPSSNKELPVSLLQDLKGLPTDRWKYLAHCSTWRDR